MKIARLSLFSASIIVFAMSLVNNHLALSFDAFERGKQLFKQKKYAQAASSFELASKQDKANPGLLYYLGLSYYYKGQRAKTVEIFKKLVADFPDSTASNRARVFLSKISTVSSGEYLSETGASGSKTAGSILPSFHRIRYREEGGDIVVATRVNERPIEMIFDTGAPDTWIGTNHLMELGIPLPVGDFKMLKSQLGENKEYKYWKMKVDLRAGGILRKNFEVLVQENRKGLPLIGQTFVKGYQFRIDHSSKELCFSTHNGSRSASNFSPRLNRNEVPFETSDGSYIKVIAMVNGKPCRMLFDTGAGDVHFPKSYVSKYGIKISPGAKVHTYTAADPSVSGSISRLKLGPIEVFDMEVIVAEWVNLEEPLLGVRFFKDWQYVIDRDKKVIRFLRRR